MIYNDRLNNIIGIDVSFEDFFFKFQHYFENKVIFEVYPKEYISPIEFTKRIIYNDKLRYHLSSILGIGVDNIQGYITTNIEKEVDTMTLIVTVVDFNMFLSLIQNNPTDLLLEDFSPMQLGGISTSVSLSINNIDLNIDDEEDIIKKPYIARVAITNMLENDIGSDSVYEILSEEIPKILNKLINPKGKRDIVGFTKLYFIQFTDSADFDTMINHRVNMLAYIVYEIDRFSDTKLISLSDTFLEIEKNINTVTLPIEVVNYFFNEDLKYREMTLFDTYINDTGEQIAKYNIEEIVCTFGKKAAFKSNYMKIANFKKLVWKEDRFSSAIYRNDNIFNRKIKYGGFINDPEINKVKVEKTLKEHPLFKDRRIHTINTLNNTNFFVLLPK